MADNIQELVDKTAGTLATMQKNFEEVESKGLTTSEGVEQLKKEFGECTANIEKMNGALEAEKKSREELELLLSKRPEGGSDTEIKSNEEYRKGFTQFLRKNRVELAEGVAEKEFTAYINQYCKHMSDDEKFLAQKSLSVGSDPNGGYLAPMDVVRKITKRVFESSPIRQMADVITTMRESVPVILDDGSCGFIWVGEEDERTETTTPGIGEVIIPVHEGFAYPKASQKILDDASIDMENWLIGKASRDMIRGENTAFVAGGGVKKPTGILSYADWDALGTYQRGALETTTAVSSTVITADELITVQGKLLEDYQTNAKWGMQRDVFTKIALTKDSSGRFQLDPQLLFNGVQLQLLGKQVRFMADMQAQTAGLIPIVYGDFKEGYTIVDRIGMRIIRDPYKKPGFVFWQMSKRVGGAVTNYQAIKRLRMKA